MAWKLMTLSSIKPLRLLPLLKAQIELDPIIGTTSVLLRSSRCISVHGVFV